MDIKELLKFAIEREASDIHLTVGLPPVLRINGRLHRVDTDPLVSEACKSLVYSILNNAQRVKFETDHELDFSLHVEGLGRFRVNVHLERGHVEAAIRLISLKVRTFEDLGLPPVVAELAMKPNGLVLVTGPTGVGKTTTLAAMVDYIIRKRGAHIITIEDPIEYVHSHGEGMIKQREVGSDTFSFAQGLRHVLRQDPDVILIGEMRDLDTIGSALTAAETGHLVLATLHTADAAQTVDRIVDVFPPHQQQQVRVQLAASLQGIVSQQLVPRADGHGLVASMEILIVTPAVRHIIRTAKTEQITTVLETGFDKGMIPMDRSLKELYQRGLVRYDDAIARAKDPAAFKRY